MNQRQQSIHPKQKHTSVQSTFKSQWEEYKSYNCHIQWKGQRPADKYNFMSQSTWEKNYHHTLAKHRELLFSLSLCLAGISPNVNLTYCMVSSDECVLITEAFYKSEWKRDTERNYSSWNATNPRTEPCNLAVFHNKLHTNDMCIDMLNWVRNTPPGNWKTRNTNTKHHQHRLQKWVYYVSA